MTERTIIPAGFFAFIIVFTWCGSSQIHLSNLEFRCLFRVKIFSSEKNWSGLAPDFLPTFFKEFKILFDLITLCTACLSVIKCLRFMERDFMPSIFTPFPIVVWETPIFLACTAWFTLGSFFISLFSFVRNFWFKILSLLGFLSFPCLPVVAPVVLNLLITA